MNIGRIRLAIAAMAAGLALWCGPGCSKAPDNTPPAGGAPQMRTIRIGMVAKSQTNDVFQAAKQGALDAAADAPKNYGVKVDIVWRTPTEEDAQKQAQNIASLASENVDGITVSCTNAQILTPAINDAVDKGIPVVCFDSDAPASKRMCDYGTDDAECGKIIMAQLAKIMGEKGTIAILAGNAGGTNIQHRVAGAQAELKLHPNMKLVNDASGGIIHHEENPEAAVEAIKGAMAASPGQIQGWAILGGWPLWTSNALDWDPGTVKVVCGDALPKQLAYLTDGHAQMLLSQDCYGWGYKTVNILLDKIVKHQDPSAAFIPNPLTKVAKDADPANDVKSVTEFSGYWDKWLKKS
jgi:ribose transport system substrate-binding protein